MVLEGEMTSKPIKLVGVFLILLVLLLSVVSVEARTFRKAVQQSDNSELGAQRGRNSRDYYAVAVDSSGNSAKSN